MRLAKYVWAHWKGRLSLSVSVLVDGLFIGAVLVGVLVAIGQVVEAVQFMYAALAIFVLWATWAGVGTLRAAVRAYDALQSSLLQRIVAVCAMAAVLTGAALVFYGFLSLFM